MILKISFVAAYQRPLQENDFYILSLINRLNYFCYLVLNQLDIFEFDQDLELTDRDASLDAAVAPCKQTLNQLRDVPGFEQARAGEREPPPPSASLPVVGHSIFVVDCKQTLNQSINRISCSAEPAAGKRHLA